MVEQTINPRSNESMDTDALREAFDHKLDLSLIDPGSIDRGGPAWVAPRLAGRKPEEDDEADTEATTGLAPGTQRLRSRKSRPEPSRKLGGLQSRVGTINSQLTQGASSRAHSRTPSNRVSKGSTSVNMQKAAHEALVQALLDLPTDFGEKKGLTDLYGRTIKSAPIKSKPQNIVPLPVHTDVPPAIDVPSADEVQPATVIPPAIDVNQTSVQAAPTYNKFKVKMLGQLRRGWGQEHPNALLYYLNDMTAKDVTSIDHAGYTDLEAILQDRFKEDPQGRMPSEWIPVKHLGQGTYGSVILWQRRISYVPEYLACKTSRFDHWFHDYNAEGQLTRRLNAAGCDNVVKIYDWAVMEATQEIRSIYEYCPHGDLHSLQQFYYDNMLVLPEAFLWHCFHSIATAICYMARGTTEDEPVEGWEEIIHKDLKQNNILLGRLDPGIDGLYPAIKVADLGMGYTVPNEAVRRFKRAYPQSSTAHWQAPETNKFIRSDRTQVPYEFPSSRSDIYSLGIIMLDLLRLPSSFYRKEAWRALDFSQESAYKYYPYSKYLVPMVLQCIKRDARERPSPLALWKATRYYSCLAIIEVEDARTAAHSGNNQIAPGMVLYNRDQQKLYADKQQNPSFHEQVRAAHMFNPRGFSPAPLFEACENPIPPPRRDLVGIMWGLEGFLTEEQIMERFSGGKITLRTVGERRDCRYFLPEPLLRAPKQDNEWRAKLPARIG